MPELGFVGVGLADASAELAPPAGGPVNVAQLRRLALAHEDAGFDAVLVASSPTAPDALVVAGEILRSTQRLGAIVTLAPSLVAPTAAARAVATLEALHPGRVAVHLPAVASDVDARRDGAPPDRLARQRQRAEFAEVLVRTWRSARPFDYHGKFHDVVGAWSAVRPPAPISLWVSGASTAAAEVAGRHDGVLLTPGSALAGLALGGGPVGGGPGARVRHALRLRPIVAATRRAADDYAEQVLRIYRGTADTPAAALRELTGALPGHRSLVGTSDDIAGTLVGYHAAGTSAVHLAGWRPLADLEQYARVIALVRGAAVPERRTA